MGSVIMSFHIGILLGRRRPRGKEGHGCKLYNLDMGCTLLVGTFDVVVDLLVVPGWVER